MKNQFIYPAVASFLALAAMLVCSSNGAVNSDPAATQPDRNLRWRAGEVIVKFREPSDPQISEQVAGSKLPWHRLPPVLLQFDATNSIASIKPVAHPELLRLRQAATLQGTYVLRFSDESLDVERVSQLLSKESTVAYAEPNYLLQLCDTPNDPYFSSAGSWGQTYDDQWGLKIAQVPAAWDLATSTNEVVVAVIDSGVDFNHPDLVGKIATNGWNYVANNANPSDDHGHGTFIAGIIAATANNGIGMAGIARHVKILPIKVLNSTGYISTSDAASGVSYALAKGARIICLSFSGVDSSTMTFTMETPAAQQAVIVASAGNNSSQFLSYPAAYGNVIAVGATDHEDRLADFSNFGPKIDLVAPGGDSGDSTNGYSILSLRAANTSRGIPLNDYYTRWRGTSFSAPFVAGVVALIRSQWPHLKSDQIRQILRGTADDVMAPGWDWQTGYGRVNAFAAIQRSSAINARIESPLILDYVSGAVTINGTAGGGPFDHFRVEVGPGLSPTNWTLIVSNHQQVFREPIATWDSTVSPDGPHVIRLTAVDATGVPHQDHVAVIVNNLEPPSHAGWPQPAGANCSAPLLADLDGDGSMEILWAQRSLMVVKQGNGNNYWSQTILESPTGPPSVADLDGDNIPEVGLISHDWMSNTGRIYLWSSSGSPKPGWPKTFYWRNPFVVREVAPVFADVDGNGLKEIIWVSGTTNNEPVIHVDKLDGSPLPGWPVTLPKVTGRVYCPPAVGDINGDGLMDLAVMTGLADVGSGYLYLLRHNGSVFSGWPIPLPGNGLGGSPALADVDNDGQLDIFAETSAGWIGMYKVTGAPMPGWPKQLSGSPESPAFADLDEDGLPEIVVADSSLNVFHGNGSLMNGWPQTLPAWILPPVIADLDQDGRLDIATGTGLGYVYAWDRNGNVMYHQGFPIKTATDSCYAGPVLGDANGDGLLDLSVFGTDNVHRSNYDLWHLGVPADPTRMPFPTQLGDNAHQSRYAPRPKLHSVSPRYVIAGTTPNLMIRGASFLKGMRLSLGTNQPPVISETATSLTFTVTANLPLGWHDLAVSNANTTNATLPQAVAVITANGDDDGDTLPNSWEVQFGLDPQDDGSGIADNGAWGDPDHDGMPNVHELWAGTNPSDPASRFAISSVARTAAGETKLTWPSVVGKQYNVYRSTNLTSGFTLLTNALPATPPTNNFTDPTTGGANAFFYRLEVQ